VTDFPGETPFTPALPGSKPSPEWVRAFSRAGTGRLASKAAGASRIQGGPIREENQEVFRMQDFKPLPLSTLAPHTGYSRPYFHTPNLVKVSSSALEVMTDLRYVAAETVRSQVTLETATQKMIVRGVRSLLVVDAEDDVIGILTSRDLMGERATRATQTRNVPYGEVQVSDAMTPAAQIEVLGLDDVLHAHVGDIVETLKHSGRQHAVVVERDPVHGQQIIRGVFSASQIARQLGIAPHTEDLKQTFADIDRAVKT
jgi:CBS domain-containing protein